MASFFYWLSGQCESRSCKVICVLAIHVLRQRYQTEISTASFWFSSGTVCVIFTTFGDAVSIDNGKASATGFFIMSLVIMEGTLCFDDPGSEAQIT